MTSSRRGVPRGPPEWGEVLYQPGWADTRWSENWQDPWGRDFIIVTSLGMAPLAVLAWMVMADIHGVLPQVVLFLLLLVSLPSSLLFISALLYEARRMPFRVYESGVTLPGASLLDGLRRRERLVPFESLKELELDNESMRNVYALRYSYEDETGGSVEGVVDPYLPFYPSQVAVAVREVAPDKLGPDLREAVEAEVVNMSETIDEEDRIHETFSLTLTMLPVAVVATALVGLSAEDWGDVTSSWLLGSALMTVLLYVPLVGGLYHSEVRASVLSLASYETTTEGIEVWLPVPSRPFVRCRGVIPFDELERVDLVVNLINKGGFCIVRTRRGKRWLADTRTFEALDGREGFERRGGVIMNVGEFTSPPERLHSLRWGRSVAIGVVIATFAPGVGHLLLMSGMDTSLGVRVTIALILSVLLLLVVPVLLWRRGILRELEKNAEGLAATSEGLQVPSQGWDRVPREAVRGIVRYRTALFRATLLRTDRGRVRLPWRLGDELEAAGYQVGPVEEEE